jgi:hypothetical protein
MDVSRVLAAGCALMVLTACGSTGATGEGSAGPVASASTPGADACAAFTDAVSRTVMPFVDIKMSMGAVDEQADRLAGLSDMTATLAADAPACAPEAAASLATLHDLTVELADAYEPATDGAAREGLNAILMQVRTAGESAWKAMGLPTSSWEYLPLHEDGTTT